MYIVFEVLEINKSGNVSNSSNQLCSDMRINKVKFERFALLSFRPINLFFDLKTKSLALRQSKERRGGACANIENFSLVLIGGLF